MCVDTINDTSTPLWTQSDVSIFMLSDMQCMTSYVSHTICCNMKIIGIIRSQMCSLGTTRDCGNRLSFLQACEGMIALYKQRKDKTQWNRYNSYKLAKAWWRCTSKEKILYKDYYIQYTTKPEVKLSKVALYLCRSHGLHFLFASKP